MKIVLASLLSAAVVVGCASSGVIPIGQDTFMISKQSSTGFHSASSVKAELFAEANTYCIGQGKMLQPVSDNGVDGVPGRSFANAELMFRCLVAGDSALGRPTRTAVPNVRIEQINKSEPSSVPSNEDTYTKLIKLKSLLDSKVITQEEFDEQKRRSLK
jgi:hypothetical protein